MSNEVSVADRPEEKRYVIEVDGARAGLLTYELREGRMTMNHAEIDPAREGSGLGGKLVNFALTDAGARGLEVLPVCPFVRHYIAEHGEFADLVPESARKRFGLA